MKKVYISGPHGLDVPTNKSVAKILTRRAMQLGFAPFAPDLFYPDYIDLDILNPKNSIHALNCGIAYLSCFDPNVDELWVYAKNGLSAGMQQEVECAEQLKIPVKRLFEL